MDKISSPAEFQVAIQSPRLSVAIFKADWCSDCKFIDPFMPEVEQKYDGRLTLVEVDVDAVGDVSRNRTFLEFPALSLTPTGVSL